MKNKKFDRLVAESTRRSLMESQRIDEGGVVKNLWNGFNAARKGMNLAQKGLQASRAAKFGERAAQGMGFGSKAAQLDVNALKRGEELYRKMRSGAALTAQEAREAQTISRYIGMRRGTGNLSTISGAGEKLRTLQRNANRWRMAGGMGLAGAAGYGLGGGSGEATGADMAGAGMDGTYPGAGYGDGMYPGGAYPGDGMYPGWGYPGVGYGDGFYGPDPNSLYAYMGGYPYGYGYDDTFGYGFGSPSGSGYGGAYNDSGMDPMMMYYMMNGGF